MGTIQKHYKPLLTGCKPLSALLMLRVLLQPLMGTGNDARVMDIGSRLELFVDDTLIDRLQGGELVTKPFRFAGRNLVINFATSAPGGLRFEIQDQERKPIPGYTLEESVEVIGNEIERVVSWKNGDDVSRLAGKPVRLRVVMKDADLYALRFR